MLDKFKLQFLIEDFIYYRKKPSIATWVAMDGYMGECEN